MFEDDYILDPQPAMTRRERRDRRDAERKRRESRFMDGYLAAERDHEDGADPRGCLARASERLETRAGDPVLTSYYEGRVAYFCVVVADLSG